MESARCGKCGATLGDRALAGLCPNCLLRTAIEGGGDSLGPAELIPHLPKLRYFGDYELLQEIARGGMGVVYRARQVTLDRTVAIKMMRPGLLATDDEVRRFRAEARLAGALQHPNIVAIHEVGDHDGLHYFSMDYVEGISLAEMVREHPLAPKAAARYVQLVADAIQFAHDKGTLHRDLKPSNVVVDLLDQPRVTDFGLARPVQQETGLTVSGSVLGTPAYMPPEQAAGKKDQLSVASDVYSLGAILFELLTGRPPFRGATTLETVKAVLETEAPSPRDCNPDVPRDLATICRKCLEKERRARYASARELALDLGRFLNGETIRARPVSTIARGVRWCRRNPWPLTAAALALLLAVAVGLVMTPPVGLRDVGGSSLFRIAVIAGPGNFGDGGPATRAWLPAPHVTAMDSAGNLYIGDTSCRCIRKVGTDGIITRVAGTGVPGESSDGALAQDASIEINPGFGLAVDPAGLVYFSETSRCRVRKVDRAGRLVTVAGTPQCGFRGDGGPAVDAQLTDPRSIAIGPDGSLFIRESDGRRIRRVGPDGFISTVAGNGSAGVTGDGGPAVNATIDWGMQIAVDRRNNLYLSASCRMRAVSPDGIIRTVAGTGECGFSGDGGPATRAQIGVAQSHLATDTAGNVYLGDGPRIRRIGTDGIITTIAGSGVGVARDGMRAMESPLVSALVFAIGSLTAFRDGEVYLADEANRRILKIGPDGILRVVAGSQEIPNAVESTVAHLSRPTSAVAGKDGNVYIGDLGNRRVWRVAPHGKMRTVAGATTNAIPQGAPSWPQALAIDSAGNLLIASQFFIWKLTGDGKLAPVAGTGAPGYSGDGGAAAQAQFNRVAGLAADAAGNLYVSDIGNQAIRQVSRDGVIRTIAGGNQGGWKNEGPSLAPQHVFLDSQGVGDGGPAKNAILIAPVGVAVDSRGNLLIADSTGYRVRRVTPEGIISTVAGNGYKGHAGEGGPASQAFIGAPSGVAVDAAGTIYFVDADFSCVWMVAADGILRKAADLKVLSISSTPDGGLLAVDPFGNQIYKLTPRR